MVSKDFMLGGDARIHRMGFGAMRVTGKGIWGPPKDPTEAKRVLRRVVELGVNFIDTADAYGPEVSENLIAEALHPYPAGLVIATKGGLVRGGPDDWSRDGRPAHLRKAIEGSLARLRLERIDLYQLHSPDSAVPLADSLGCLAELQRAGKIRHVGVSNFDVRQLEEGSKVVKIVSVQNRYSVLDRHSEDVLRLCEKREMAFIPWYPLAAGDLSRAKQLEAIASKHRATPHQVALAWLLQHSANMVPIPGTSSVKHLEENVAATSVELSADELRALAG